MTSTELQIKNIVYEEFSKLISNIEGDFKTNFVKKRYNLDIISCLASLMKLLLQTWYL